MGPEPIEDIGQRKVAVRAGAAAAMPKRVIKSELADYRQHKPGDMLKGVVMIIGTSESDYSNGLGMVAKEGRTHFMAICHLEVSDRNEATMGQSVEAAEDALIEDFKLFIRTGVQGLSLQLEKCMQSRQLEKPRGWVRIDFSAGPPRANSF